MTEPTGTGDLIKRLRDTVVSRSTCKKAADALEEAVRVIARVNRMSTANTTDYLPQLRDIMQTTDDYLARHATGQRKGGDDE